MVWGLLGEVDQADENIIEDSAGKSFGELSSVTVHRG